MLLIESAFVLKDYKLPVSILPSNTPYEIISTMHRLFPAFMSGCRCIISAFYVDIKETRVQYLQPIMDLVETNQSKIMNIVQTQQETFEFNYNYQKYQKLRKLEGFDGDLEKTVDETVFPAFEGIMERANKLAKNKFDPLVSNYINEKIKLISDPNFSRQKSNKYIEMLGYFIVFMLVRMLALKLLNHNSIDGK